MATGRPALACVPRALCGKRSRFTWASPACSWRRSGGHRWLPGLRPSDQTRPILRRRAHATTKRGRSSPDRSACFSWPRWSSHSARRSEGPLRHPPTTELRSRLAARARRRTKRRPARTPRQSRLRVTRRRRLRSLSQPPRSSRQRRRRGQRLSLYRPGADRPRPTTLIPRSPLRPHRPPLSTQSFRTDTASRPFGCIARCPTRFRPQRGSGGGSRPSFERPLGPTRSTGGGCSRSCALKAETAARPPGPRDSTGSRAASPTTRSGSMPKRTALLGTTERWAYERSWSD